MENYNQVIVIGRCFGAGGRTVGRNLAATLNIPFYDNELLAEAASKFGFSREVFARVDEKRPSFLKRLLTQSYGVQESFGNDTLSAETLYHAQSRVIKAIAACGPCVIVGRTADYILRDLPNLVSVFLHAPLSLRAKQIVERGDSPSLEEAIELARQKDRQRQEYYDYFTGRHWGEASNYDLTINFNEMITLNGVVDLILQFINSRAIFSPDSRNNVC